jgi:hypothetical protein
MENSKKRVMKEAPNYHVQARLGVRSIESAVSLPNTLFRVRGRGSVTAIGVREPSQIWFERIADDIELTLGISSNGP